MPVFERADGGGLDLLISGSQVGRWGLWAVRDGGGRRWDGFAALDGGDVWQRMDDGSVGFGNAAIISGSERPLPGPMGKEAIGVCES